jgi:hypothetical protein
LSQEERTGRRPGEYSAWHRRASIKRFVGIERAQLLSLCDIDAALWLEHDDLSKEPLALIETAMDVGQSYKSGTVLQRLAKRASVPAYLCMCKLGDQPNPADPTYRDLIAVKVRRVWPRPEQEWRELTPSEWARGLVRIREWSAARLDREPANDPRW